MKFRMILFNSILPTENTSLLYLSMILLAYGGNQLRLSGYQFCNLFPKYRGTALTIISGLNTHLQACFLYIKYFKFQLGQQYHMSIKVISFGLTGLTLLSLVATVIMPWHSVLSNDAGHCTSKEPPLLSSLLSFSSFTHAIWLSIHLGSAVFFALYFNSWISQIAQTNDEAGFYSLLYSFICLACFAVTPFPGLVMDFLYKKAEKGNVYINIHHDFESLSPTSSLNKFLRQENCQKNAFFCLAHKS
ncbi:hypothetical protein Avbf_16645 [Armadillidium vulgare]|nr:hypothetical protein Avbf_16645 [Armadillidium vulgare]